MSTRASLSFAAMATIWGVPYLFIKIAVDDGVSPAAVAWARTTLAAALLLVLAARARTLSGLRGRLRWVAAFGVVEIAIPFPLIAFGEQHIASSLAAILIAAVPLMIALIALRFDRGERPSPVRMLGLVVGFAGVVTLVGVDVSGRPAQLLGALAVLLAAAGYALGPMILKHRLAGLDPKATMGASLAVASLVLTPAAILTAPSGAPRAGAAAAIVILGIVCTAAAFVLYNTLISEIGPARASVITYLNPVVAVAVGVAVLGEAPGAGAAAGLLLILAGSWLSTNGGTPPRLLATTRARRRQARSRGSSLAARGRPRRNGLAAG